MKPLTFEEILSIIPTKDVERLEILTDEVWTEWEPCTMEVEG